MCSISNISSIHIICTSILIFMFISYLDVHFIVIYDLYDLYIRICIDMANIVK